MNREDVERLQSIRTFPQLVKYLRDDLGWPIESGDADDLTFDYEPHELGLDDEVAVKIKQIKQLRPLTGKQPWGIFFINFEPKRLPVVVLRRILSALAIKKRASAARAHQAAWAGHDLLFISSYGTTDERSITFAHFTEEGEHGDLPALRVLAWDDQDTLLHLEDAHETLKQKLQWPKDENDLAGWRDKWSSAFTLRHRQVVTSSKELAERLADLARSIRKRANLVLAIESKNGPFKKLHAAFKEALVHDLSEDGFADMYAQTVTYGLLTARVSRPAALLAENLTDMVPVTNPFLKVLLGTFLNIGGRRKKIDFDELGINDVVELLRETDMEAIMRDFGNKTQSEDPVIYFYESFLHEYDAKEKVKRGVFYTPVPVVSFIVRSVDELLKTEFGLEDGLADTTTWGELKKRKPEIELPKHAKPETPFVQILDFATGTGTFIVQVIDVVYKTMSAKWKKAGYRELEIAKLWDDYVPKHLLPRLYGFELMMAPYAIAHMKIGLKLFETGYRFRTEERVRLFLTNTLEEPKDFSTQIELFAPALAHEARAANRVKAEVPITVVMGNPPYSIISANQNTWIASLTEHFKTRARENERQFQALSDDYVKFMAFSEWRINSSGMGVLGIITNNGYLDGHLFIDLRQSFLTTFGNISIINLHGNTRLKEHAPDGKIDENIFDILTGVVINISSKHDLNCTKQVNINYADIWGSRKIKYDFLLNHNVVHCNSKNIAVAESDSIFIPRQLDLLNEWNSFHSLLNIFGTGNPKVDAQKAYAAGFVSQQDDFAIAFHKKEINQRVNELLEKGMTEKKLRANYRLCKTNQWDFVRSRRELSNLDYKKLITVCLYRPFDKRWTLFNRGVVTILRTEIMKHLHKKGNFALIATRGISIQNFAHIFVSDSITDRHAIDNAGDSMFVFPLFRYYEADGTIFQNSKLDLEPTLNMSQDYLDKLTAMGYCTNQNYGNIIFAFMYALLNSPIYRARYSIFLKTDFPHIPLPISLSLFNSLSALGGSLIRLHTLDSDCSFPIETQRRNSIETLLNNPVVKFLDSGFRDVAKGFPKYDSGTVFINPNDSGFKGVPEDVWNFHIGGYQVCEKWLKDRRGRTLSDEDIEHYQKIVVALKETIRLMGEIDKVIEEHGGFPDAFVTDPKVIEEAKAKAG